MRRLPTHGGCRPNSFWSRTPSGQMSRGIFFSTAESHLANWTRELDDTIPDLFPALADGSLASRLRRQPNELTGNGIAVADGASFRAGTPIGLYFGSVCTTCPLDEYAFTLRSFRFEKAEYELVVDAGAYCRRSNPLPVNVALFNHACQERTVRLGWGSQVLLPCVVAYSARDLVGGEALVYNYDSDLSVGAYTLDRREKNLLVAAGLSFVPCACSAVAPCPRDRWFRSYGGLGH